MKMSFAVFKNEENGLVIMLTIPWIVFIEYWRFSVLKVLIETVMYKTVSKQHSISLEERDHKLKWKVLLGE